MASQAEFDAKPGNYHSMSFFALQVRKTELKELCTLNRPIIETEENSASCRG